MQYTAAQKDGLHGPTRMYWVDGADGIRRGPAALSRDGVKRMEERGATVVPVGRGGYVHTERRPEQ